MKVRVLHPQLDRRSTTTTDTGGTIKIVSIVVETPAIPDSPEVGTLRATYDPPFTPEMAKLLQEQVEADEHHKAAKKGFEGS